MIPPNERHPAKRSLSASFEAAPCLSLCYLMLTWPAHRGSFLPTHHPIDSWPLRTALRTACWHRTASADTALPLLTAHCLCWHRTASADSALPLLTAHCLLTPHCLCWQRAWLCTLRTVLPVHGVPGCT